MSAKVRKSYSIGEKLAALDFVRHHSVEETARTFRVDAKQIREWRKNEGNIRKLSEEPNGKKRSRLQGAGRPLHSDELEERLRTWILNQRQQRIRVSRRNVQKMAQKMNIEMSLSRDFKASNGWVDKFLSRNHFVIRSKTSVCQKTPADHLQKLVSFVRYVRQLRVKHNYPRENIFAMDETPVWLEGSASTTIAQKGAKEVPIKSTGHEKVRITVILTGRGDGSKMKPYIIIPRKKPISELDNMNDVVIQYNTKSWMDDFLTEDYLKRVIGQFHFSKRLMVWDAFKCHISKSTSSVLRRMGIHAAVIPGGCTGLIQPADVSWNRSLKSRIQDKYDEWLSNGEHTFTANGNMRPPSFVQLVDWIRESWNSIPKEQIEESMKQCGITNFIDGSEDDKILCFKPGRGLNQGLTLLRSECAELQNEQESDCDEDMMAIDSDDDDDISWCASDESN